MEHKADQSNRVASYFDRCKEGLEIRLSKYQIQRINKGESVIVYRNLLRHTIGPKKSDTLVARKIKKLQEQIKLLKNGGATK